MPLSSTPSFRKKSLDRVVDERARAIWRRLPLVGRRVDDAPRALDVRRGVLGAIAEFFEDEGYGVPLDLFYLSAF